MVRSAHQQVSREEIQRIVESRHDAPDTVLGPHFVEEDKTLVIRAFLPRMARVLVCEKGASERKYAMERIHEAGLFEATILDADDAMRLTQVFILSRNSTLNAYDRKTNHKLPAQIAALFIFIIPNNRSLIKS